MRRRQVLTAFAGSSGLVALAGCTTSGTTDNDSSPTETSTTSPTATDTPTETPAETSVPDNEASPSASPEETPTATASDSAYKAVEIGGRDNVENPDNNEPHVIEISNEGDSTRGVDVQVNRGGDGSETVLDVEYDIPGGATVKVNLLEPDVYAAAIRVPEAGKRVGIDISRDDFDCNWTEYQTTIHPDGRVEVTEVSSTMACSTATSQ